MCKAASRRILFVSLLALGHLLTPTKAVGQSEKPAGDKPAGQRFALLVGVRQYDPTELKNLQFAEADVTALAKLLEEGGFRKDNVMLMTQTRGAENSRALPQAANIRKELDLLLKGRGKDDVVLVAFAGHGVQFAGTDENFFCPMDARLAERDTLVSLQEVSRALEKCEAGLKVLLVDACRDDPQSQLSRSREQLKLESVTRPPKELPSGGVAIFCSCSGGQKAYEDPELKHGIFFFHVLEGLRGAAARDNSSDVYLGDLEFFVNNAVEPYVRNKLGKKQQPQLLTKLQGAPQPLVSWPKAPAPTTTALQGIDPRFLPGAVGPTDRVKLPGYAARDHTVKRVLVLRQLTNHRPMEAPKYAPEMAVLSADGSKIAYFAPQTGIWTMNADGTDNQLAVPNQPNRAVPVAHRLLLSPDGRRVYWQGNFGPIYRVNADGSDLRELTKFGAEYPAPRLRVWGHRIYYGTRAGIASVDTEGVGDIQNILTQKDLFKVFNIADLQLGEFDVSEKGDRLACRIYDPDQKRHQLFAFSVGGDPATDLRTVVTTDFEPTKINISPDGRFIFFGKYGGGDYVVNWDGSGYRPVQVPPPNPNGPIQFTPDGRWLTYFVDYGGTVTTTLDGSDRVEPVQTGPWNGSDLAILHGPSPVSFSRDLRRFTYIMDYFSGPMPRQLVAGEINPLKADGLPVLAEIAFPKTLAFDPQAPNHTGEMRVRIQKGTRPIERVQFVLTPMFAQDKEGRWAADRGWHALRGDHQLRDDGTNGDEKAGDDVWTTNAFGAPVAGSLPAGKYLVRIVVHEKTTFRGFEKANAVIVDVDGVEIK